MLKNFRWSFYIMRDQTEWLHEERVLAEQEGRLNLEIALEISLDDEDS